MILIDTNILLRFILDDDVLLSPKAKVILEKINQSSTKAIVSLLVISEVIFTLERSYNIARVDIIKMLLNIMQLSNLAFEKEDYIKKALAYYTEKRVSFIDAYHVVMMGKKRIKNIYSFDHDFDKFPQIKRLER